VTASSGGDQRLTGAGGLDFTFVKKPAKVDPARILNAERLAVFFNLTKQRVHQLVAEGMPRELRGKYDLDKCAQWYIRYLQSVIEKKAIPMDDGEYASEHKEKIRKMRLEADLKEIDLAQRRGQLIAIGDVDKEMSELVLTTKARLMSVPARLAPELVGENSRVMIQAKLDKSLREALGQLAAKAESAHE